MLAVWRFERALQRDLFRSRPFNTFRKTTYESVLRMQFLSAARARNVSQSCREMARLISEVNSG